MSRESHDQGKQTPSQIRPGKRPSEDMEMGQRTAKAAKLAEQLICMSDSNRETYLKNFVSNMLTESKVGSGQKSNTVSAPEKTEKQKAKLDAPKDSQLSASGGSSFPQGHGEYPQEYQEDYHEWEENMAAPFIKSEPHDSEEDIVYVKEEPQDDEYDQASNTSGHSQGQQANNGAQQNAGQEHLPKKLQDVMAQIHTWATDLSGKEGDKTQRNTENAPLPQRPGGVMPPRPRGGMSPRQMSPSGGRGVIGPRTTFPSPRHSSPVAVYAPFSPPSASQSSFASSYGDSSFVAEEEPDPQTKEVLELVEKHGPEKAAESLGISMAAVLHIMNGGKTQEKPPRMSYKHWTMVQKAEVVAVAGTQGVGAASTQFGIPRNTIYQWKKQVAAQASQTMAQVEMPPNT